jgi:hypothetical protein
MDRAIGGEINAKIEKSKKKNCYTNEIIAKSPEHEYFFYSNFNFRARYFIINKKKMNFVNFFKYKDITHARIYSWYTKLVSFYLYIV